MQVLVPQSVLGKLPSPILVLNQQIQRPLQRARQAFRVVFLIRLRHTARRALKRLALGFRCRSRNRIALLLGTRRLRILQQPINLPLQLALLRPDEHLVVPRLLSVTLVPPNVARRSQPLRHLALPFAVRRRARFEIEIPCKRQGEALVEALLVQKEGGFEGVQIAGDLGRAGEEDACVDGVGGARRGLGYWGNVLLQGVFRRWGCGGGGCVGPWCGKTCAAYRVAYWCHQRGSN